jgi:hypothetical protein
MVDEEEGGGAIGYIGVILEGYRAVGQQLPVEGPGRMKLQSEFVRSGESTLRYYAVTLEA